MQPRNIPPDKPDELDADVSQALAQCFRLAARRGRELRLAREQARDLIINRMAAEIAAHATPSGDPPAETLPAVPGEEVAHV